ncbi:MAG: hypothetical protein HYX27_08835 [Acidobacteria bacterium]|nr:hypothetical protein [Acidobacteriota bacterium]
MIEINTEHHEYKARNALWKQYRDLYTGGAQFKAQAGEYLVRRNREPMGVYNERLNHAYYENYIGSIVDWYAATLFRREPVISVEGENESGRKFFSAFVEDCDRKGSNLSDFFRKQILEALIYGSSYTLVDFPRQHKQLQNRAEEDALGASNAYLVSYSPDELINWSTDEQGEFEWIVIRTSQMRRQRLEDPEPMLETNWHYYDRQSFRSYRQISKPGMFGTGEAATDITLIDEGLHGLANQHRVPVFEMRLTEGMWLLNKAASLQLEHFNKSNALGWALTMGLFAMPVVYSDREWNKVVGDSYYIHLGKDDRFGWAEPEGHVYEIASRNLERLKEEIYRVCYLLAQAGQTSADGRLISGLSKQRDFAITQEVLRGYGDTVKDVIRRVLLAVERARVDNLSVSVSGMDEFDIGDFSAEIEDARKLLEMGIGSPSLRRQIYKKLAFKYLCDERQELKDTIAREIDEWMFREKQ